VRFAWQGSGVSAIVTGNALTARLRTEDTDSVFFQAAVDGRAGMRFEVEQGADRTIELASGLSGGDHRIDLYRETEGMYGVSIFLGFGGATVKGPTPEPKRRIEVVGDSISAGYGNLGAEPHPDWVANPACSWTAENSSWYQTYAARAGRMFDAEVTTLARSGWGMYWDRGGDKNGALPTVYDNTLGVMPAPGWDFAIKVSVVIINLGTNDWAPGDPGMPYQTAYLAFLERVRSHYPDAWLFLTIGSMLNPPELAQVDARLQAVVSARASAGDDKITTFDMGTQDLGSNGEVVTGCDWHPSVTDHERMAEILQGQLKAKLGW
jgi:lysophospholipase L1-like esterase